VFVIDGGRTKVRKVKIGMRGADMAEVLSGLREGEKVVTHPPERTGTRNVRGYKGRIKNYELKRKKNRKFFSFFSHNSYSSHS
jgi:hypothetical protein